MGFCVSYSPLCLSGWRAQLVPTQLEHKQLFIEHTKAQTWLLGCCGGVLLWSGLGSKRGQLLMGWRHPLPPSRHPLHLSSLSHKQIHCLWPLALFFSPLSCETVNPQLVIISRAWIALVFVCMPSLHLSNFSIFSRWWLWLALTHVSHSGSEVLRKWQPNLKSEFFFPFKTAALWLLEDGKIRLAPQLCLR